MSSAATTAAASAAPPIIATTGLSKRYDQTLAVDNLSLRVPRGGVFGLLGPNGSGKTTMISMLLGLVRPSAGSIRLLDAGLPAGDPAALRRIGSTVETPAFYPYLSGRDNLRYFQGISHRGEREDVEQLLQLVDLAPRGHSKFQTYSQGMKQRLGIACALLGDPELIFLDEPTNGLDPAGVVQVRELIRRLGAGGRTIVLSSHLLHEVEQVCDGVAIIVRGKLIIQGSVAQLLRQGARLRLRSTDEARAASILGRLDWVSSVGRDDGSLLVEAPVERAGELTRALAQQDVYVTQLEPLQLSLEDYFLQVTGDAAPAEVSE